MIKIYLFFYFFLIINAQRIKEQKSKVLKTHSLELPYIGKKERTGVQHDFKSVYLEEGLQNRWFDFGGNAIVDTNKHIRLTSTASSQQGYLWSRLVKKKRKSERKRHTAMKLIIH
jgi:mannose-binding lectin 2